MQNQNQRNHSTRSRTSTYPCPKCHRIIRAGDRFCGFCHERLLVQCSHCGRWTKANHVSCPGCGEDLHAIGLTFAQRQQLRTLKQQEQGLLEARAVIEHRLDGLSVERSWTCFRLIVVLMILVVVVLIGGALVKGLVASMWGIIILLVALLFFRRGFMVMLSMIPKLLRWAIPRPISALRIEAGEAYAELNALRVELQKAQDTIADLERKEKAHHSSPMNGEEEEKVGT
ncbi:MAG: zinc ribbon domain-containing protein [Ktedonobacteraceae bacterium]|nr:zinc ribbon domain-containing protein [Ktedonobacteraceae bacterium]